MTDLRALRQQLGLTQAQLADELGVSTKQVNERENGKCPVKRETLLAMEALALRRPPSNPLANEGDER